MNDTIIKIVKIIVTILDKLTFFLRTSNKVTFISYRSDELPEDMKIISKELTSINNECKQIYLSMKYKNTFTDKIRYFYEIIRQVYHIKTSKVVLLDGNNFVVSNINKKDTTVIQLWHATGAIKKFGADYTRKYNIKNYDYIITASSTSKDIMASAFNINKDRVLPIGCSWTDELFDEKAMELNKEKILNKHPKLRDKRVILYAPTFRGEAVYEKGYLDIDLENISNNLIEDTVLIYKFHPILDNINMKDYHNIYNVYEESLPELFAVSDVLISDYSAIIFDYCILEKPIILYVPDLEEYTINRGLYYDYNDFAPGSIIKSEKDLIEYINSEKMENYKSKQLKYDYFDYKDGKSSNRIANLINDKL